jgi:hypothetical protein
MSISPIPVPPDRPERARYDWSKVVLGEWQCWLDARGENLTDEDAMRRATRIRLAARDHARRHDLKLESRRIDHGRVLDLRFTSAL